MSDHKPIFGPLDPPPTSVEILDDFLEKVWGNSLSELSAFEAATSLSVAYTDLTARRLPLRGVVYSFVLHEIAVFWLLLFPYLFGAQEAQSPMENPVAWVRPSEPLYLPALGGGRSGGGRPAPAGGSRRSAAPGSAGRSRPSPPPVKLTRGLVYPGPQAIVSNPPRPDNRIQTILQPDMVRPPKLEVPLALPNLVMISRAPQVLPPPPVPVRLTPRPPVPPPPPQTRPEAPDLPTVRPTVNAQTLPSATRIAAPPPPKVKVVPKLALPPPPPPKAERPTVPPVASLPEPPQLVAAAGVSQVDVPNILVLSPVPAPPSAGPPDVPAGEARGQFAISPDSSLSAAANLGMGPMNDTVASTRGGVPSADAGSEGAGAVGGTGTPLSEGTGSGGGGGGGADPAGSSGTGTGIGNAAGPGFGTGGNGESAGSGGSGSGAGSGQGAGSGSGSGQGTGVGAGSGPGEGPFAGITIADAGRSAPMADGGGSRGGPKAQDNSKYGFTIVASGGTGGGLKDYGVFRNESVYTVYIDMRQADAAAPAWILQYALLQENTTGARSSRSTTVRSVQMETPVQAPFPTEKEYPKFPEEIVARNLGRMVVVYTSINSDGKPEQSRIIQSPNPLLNQPVLEALKKWSFRPAEMNKKPVAVKALLGITLSAPR